MTPSSKQQAVLDAAIHTTNNLGINSVAGSGKTTMLLLLMEVLNGSTLACAFNKTIADELSQRVPWNVTVRTLNGLGHGIVSKHFSSARFVKDLKTETWLQKSGVSKDQYYKIKNVVKRVVSAMKGSLVLEAAPEMITDIMDHLNLDWPEKMASDEFTRLVNWVYLACLNDTDSFDFDDQIFFPIYYDLAIPKFDNLLVDELQDLNSAQQELCFRAGRRLFAVGDPRQAIYGFRGADIRAFDGFMGRAQANVLPLSISYRCSKAVVRAAQKIVPYIESHPDAIEGKEATLKRSELVNVMEPGDFVLCRNNAPLIAACFELLRADKKAVVRGRDISAQLVTFVKKLSQNDLRMDSGEFYERLKEHRFTETEKLSRTERTAAIEALNDRCDTIEVFIEKCETVGAILQRIDEIFSDSIDGIVCSTGHKAKGLETKRVAVIKPELLKWVRQGSKPWEVEQLRNLEYVIMTRSKDELLWLK
jgi:DNA helicase-2/ATP-dependent DNA helicase PcrA